MIRIEDEPPSHNDDLDRRVRLALSSTRLASERKDELSYLYGISLLSRAIVEQFLDDVGE